MWFNFNKFNFDYFDHKRKLSIFLLLTASILSYQNCGNNSDSASPNNSSQGTPVASATPTAASVNPMTLSSISTADPTTVGSSAPYISAEVTVTDAASNHYVVLWTLLDSNDNPVITSAANNGVLASGCSGQVCAGLIIPPDITATYNLQVQVTDDQNNTMTATTEVVPVAASPTPTPPRVCPAWGCGGPPILPLPPVNPSPTPPRVCPAWGCDGPPILPFPPGDPLPTPQPICPVWGCGGPPSSPVHFFK